MSWEPPTKYQAGEELTIGDWIGAFWIIVIVICICLCPFAGEIF